jgi:hypothetical protein
MACFAWLQSWCSGGKRSAVGGADAANPLSHPKRRKVALPKENKSKTSGGKIIYLCQNHEQDTAVTIKENCNSRWNNAWICRGHGSLDFKMRGARGTTHHLLSAILAKGVDVKLDGRWKASLVGKTCHHDGKEYQGRMLMGSVEEAVRYLKHFVKIVACPFNLTETQAWIDAL